ncbi:sulfurtransferase [Microbacterium dextranolyticum]|uniref:Sulfurtransferase n=1 Tax=Microbacterium dextranolyticum TaxID=36806 RepID=A0A9W6M490_9MICO|nr:rhodanese-like domain-containing protein [Microbacterium dextranolyticum]MBM7461793.1 thiosulfate/3-mercaptopyruvate sulfurtransferase [Microbacterium dextranolyticum]GLJ94034.1 sulfurtransferase [Microbacterium dextranolyticum]
MPHLIDVAELRAQLAGARPVRLLDVRWRLDLPEGRPAYLAAHLPNAVYVDLERELARPGHPEQGRLPLPQRDDLERAARRWGLDDGDVVVAYDDNASVAAARAWWLLRPRGVDIRVLDGGIRAWIAQGLPVGRGDHVAVPGTVRLGDVGPRVAEIEDAARAPYQGTLIDVRAPEHYRGSAGGADPVSGHIPGAINLPTATHIAEDGRFRDAERVRAALHERGIAPGDDVVIYCGAGVASAHSALALATAGVTASVYAGSWSQWSRDPERPVAVGPTPEGVFQGW